MPTGAQILAFLQQIATQVAELVNPIASILVYVKLTAKEAFPQQILQIVTAIKAVAVDPDVGNANLHAQLVEIQALVVAMGSPQQAGAEVTLPTVPPFGYGAPAATDVSSAVWAEVMDAEMLTAKDYFIPLGRLAYFKKNYLTTSDYGAYFTPYVIPDQGDPVGGVTVPTFNPSDITATETLLACLVRQNPGSAAAWSDGTLAHAVITLAGTGWVTWDTTFDGKDFEQMRLLTNPPVGASSGPPVWPGLANVVLGSPVALATGLTVSTPMDGVIVTVTSVPPGTSAFIFDDQSSYRYIGAIAFVDDDGHEEFPQNLGFQSALYCPRSMAVAAAVKLRTKPGIVGTLTPWVRT